MRAQIIRRILESLGLLVAGTIAIFALLHSARGGVIKAYLQKPGISAGEIDALQHQLGPDRPAVVQYFGWLSLVVRGDLGWSTYNGEAARAIADRLPATIELTLFGLAVAIVLGAAFGVVRARTRTRALSGTLAALELLARSTPVFLVLLLAQIAVVWGPVPIGISSGERWNLGDHLRHLAAPVLLLALPFGAWVSCVFHDSLRERDTIERVASRELLRPALVSISVIGPALLAGSLFAEIAFAWPGVSRLFWTAHEDAGLLCDLLLVYWAAIVLMKIVVSLALTISGEWPARRSPADDRGTGPRRALFANPLTVAGGVLCAVLGIVALAANILPLPNPNLIDQVHWQGYPLAPGVGGHLLGTDVNGRDLLARLLYGVRNSLAIVLPATLAATLIGLAIADVAKALFSFRSDRALAVAGIRSFGALPFVMFAIPFIGSARASAMPATLALAIGAVSWPAIVVARCDESAVGPRTLIAAVAGVLASTLLMEVTLAYAGFGVQPPNPSMGNLLSYGFSNLGVAPWAVLFPAAAVVAALFAINAVADGLRDWSSYAQPEAIPQVSGAETVRA